MNEQRISKPLKIIIGIVVAIVVLGLAYLLFPKSYITMSVAPSAVTLKIDNGKPRGVTTGQTVFVIAGKHTYTFARDGFASQTITLSSGNNGTKEILLALVPQTDAAKAILKNDTDASHAVQERVESVKEAAVTDALTKKYPILSILPIESHSFEMTSCSSQKYPNDPTKIALCVFANDPDTIAPLVEATLKAKGYNPDNYEIIYSTPTTNDISPPGRGDD